MTAAEKTKEQPRSELVQLRQRLADLEKSESKHQQIVETLRESEKRYRLLVETMNEGLALANQDYVFTYVNDRFCEMLGYSRGELVEHQLMEFVHDDHKELMKDQIARRKRGEEERYELAWRAKDGGKIYTLISPRGFFDEAGQFTGGLGVVTDITERKLAEGELRESRERYRSLVENIDLGINLIDANHTILMVNAATARMLKKPTSYFIGKKCFREFEQHTTVCTHCPGTQAMATRKPADIETEAVLEDGSTFPVRIRAFPTFEPDGTSTGFIEVVEDISKNKQAEENNRQLEAQLLQAKKLESIANLSGGVARELNNLFETVQGYVERLLWDRRKDDAGYQELLDITHAALRGARLTRKLLTFSGGKEAKKQIVDLNHEVTKAQKLLNRTMPKSIELELNLANDLGTINSDPTQLEQIVLSLALNARDAMPAGGKITIGTERVILDKDFCRSHPEAEPGEYVMLSISDTGPGIGHETLVHVFDPFYTKKDLDDNEGLGLSMVYGIVKSHGGFILSSSESDMGTTFKIYFPATKKK